MDLDAEFNKLRKLTARVEPVIAEYEARQGDAPQGDAPEQSAELSKVFDRLDLIEASLATLDQVEGENIPPGVQDLAQRIIERMDRIEEKFAGVDKLATELARLSRMTADLAEIVENKAPASPGSADGAAGRDARSQK